jgi:hypothetical protein
MTDSDDTIAMRELITRTTSLVDELKAKNAKELETKEAEKWTKTAGVSLVVIAVLAATAVQKSGSYGSRAALHTNQATYLQVQASDEWAFFQAKSTKAHLFLLGAELIEQLGPNGAEEAKMIESTMKKERQYEAEKADIEKVARDLEQKRDIERNLATENAEAGGKLGRAVTGYQMCIAVASVGLVIKKRQIWLLSLVIGAFATAWMLWCFMHAPAP